jgi:hypothetical protein
MNVVCINGRRIESNTGTIEVRDNKVYIDGKLIQDCDEIKEKVIKITVEGDVGKLQVGSSEVTINGNCQEVNTGSGDVNIKGAVSGSVSTSSGDVRCEGNIGGNVRTSSGDISCSEIKGDATTSSGDINKSFFKKIGGLF